MILSAYSRRVIEDMIAFSEETIAHCRKAVAEEDSEYSRKLDALQARLDDCTDTIARITKELGG